MAIRTIVKEADELLRKKSKKVTNFDKKLWELLEDMKETMYNNDGMGLAAPQVGILKRIFIIECNNAFIEFINPVIIKESGEDIEEEACLSVGAHRGLVKRPMNVTVKAQDRYGYDFTISGEKYLARFMCHENDHLNGVLFIDREIKESEVKG